VIDTVLGLIFLFYALAIVCGGLVEMIANWVKKRAKYLLRGIRTFLTTYPPTWLWPRGGGGSGYRTPPRPPSATAWSRTSDTTQCFEPSSDAPARVSENCGG
jgi:hypothetical protein